MLLPVAAYAAAIQARTALSNQSNSIGSSDAIPHVTLFRCFVDAKDHRLLIDKLDQAGLREKVLHLSAKRYRNMNYGCNSNYVDVELQVTAEILQLQSQVISIATPFMVTSTDTTQESVNEGIPYRHIGQKYRPHVSLAIFNELTPKYTAQDLPDPDQFTGNYRGVFLYRTADLGQCIESNLVQFQ